MQNGLEPLGKGVVMPAVTDTGFVEMRLAKVVGMGSADSEVSCVVVLDGVSEDRHLPIWVGETEAFNLSCTLTGMEFARPMSPQFAAGLLHALGGRIRQVRIDRLMPVPVGGTAYCATVEVESAAGVELVDARPSDALNLVALVPAPIFVAREVLAEAEASRAGDSAEAVLLRRALEAEQMTVQRASRDR
jgi:bifunctional DNase/RNase